MLFNSISFLYFFPIVVIFFYLLNPLPRRYFLLAASLYFYMCWKAEYIVLILFTMYINYYAAIQLAKTQNPKVRKRYLLLGVLPSFALLFVFKYLNFVGDSVRSVFEAMNILIDIPYYNLLLPVGISFFTFQTLSYTFDVYKGHTPVEKSFSTFALFVSFFPQLVAGPIERSNHLLPGLKKDVVFNIDNFAVGFRIMLIGFFKKIVVADRLSIYVNTVYNNAEHHNGLTYIVATIFFSFQIYCDFSGYSDIAIGSARMMGIDLMQNFRRPYFAKNIKEFWSRWHISLSTWFRDYVYVPLGGNRVKYWRWVYNIMITFLLSGLWHGASWTFVIWGGIHGFFSLASVGFRPNTTKKKNALFSKPLVVFGMIVINYIIVLLAWVFFRANSFDDAILILTEMFRLSGDTLYMGGADPENFFYGVLAILMLLVIDGVQEYSITKLQFFRSRKTVVRYLAYATIIAIIMMLGVFDSSQFIYFQF
ncbi:MAG: MBOAT family protein [Bacteroidota bacterium]|nr:MAG: MBOAT family protein [Bacteroidota bacterium]